MAVETSSDQDRPSQSSLRNQSGGAPISKNGLLPGERIVSELKSTNDSGFQLSHSRVIFRGGADSNAVYASAQLKDVSSVNISRRPRARRSAAWGVVGLFAAIGVWQVTPNTTVGVAAALLVALISLVLMGDYWIRPAGVHFELHTTGGGIIGGEVDGKVATALEFAREVENTRRKLVPNRIRSPYRNYASG
jgi:hypothetical protein